MPTSRRQFLWGSAATATGLFLPTTVATAQPVIDWTISGPDFAGWSVTLGDSLRSPYDGLPVTLADIATVSDGQRSELRANVQRRPIMAHNITYNRIDRDDARAFTQTARYEFRLPYIPMDSGASDENAETLEGMLVVWDGRRTRLDHGLGFQWRLNPWVHDEFGTVWTWEANANAGQWVRSAPLAVDTAWHRVEMTVNFREQSTRLTIDGRDFPSSYSRTIDNVRRGWGTETAARIQGEIVSCSPEPARLRAMHRAEFRNWSWSWRWP